MVRAVFHLAQHPVGQHRDAAVRGDQHQDHRGQFDLADRPRLDLGRGQEGREDIQPGAIDRIGDQHLVAEILGLDEILRRQRVLPRGDEGRGIVEQGVEDHAGQDLGVRGDHQIDLFAQKRAHRVEGKAGADIDVDLGPGVAKAFQHRKQPVKAGVTLDRDMQSPGPPRAQRAELLVQRRDLGQDPLGRAQHPHPRRRQLQRFRAAHEQFDPGLILQPLDLMAQRRLGDVHRLGGPRQPARLMDRLDRPKVPEFQMHRPAPLQ